MDNMATVGIDECINIKRVNESRIKSNGSLEFKETVLESVHSGLGCNFHRDS